MIELLNLEKTDSADLKDFHSKINQRAHLFQEQHTLRTDLRCRKPSKCNNIKTSPSKKRDQIAPLLFPEKHW